jgi:hypothetical protein
LVRSACKAENFPYVVLAALVLVSVAVRVALIGR